MRARSHFLMLITTMITVAIRPNSGRGWRQKLNAGPYLAPMSASSPTTHHSLTLPRPSTPSLRIQIQLLPDTAGVSHLIRVTLGLGQSQGGHMSSLKHFSACHHPLRQVPRQIPRLRQKLPLCSLHQMIKSSRSNSGDAVEDTQTGDYRLFRLLTENQQQGVLRLLQQICRVEV